MGYTTISVDEKTKTRFDKNRQTPKGEVGADDYLNWLLDTAEQIEKKK